jgi:hypothetical protein
VQEGALVQESEVPESQLLALLLRVQVLAVLLPEQVVELA